MQAKNASETASVSTFVSLHLIRLSHHQQGGSPPLNPQGDAGFGPKSLTLPVKSVSNRHVLPKLTEQLKTSDTTLYTPLCAKKSKNKSGQGAMGNSLPLPLAYVTALSTRKLR